MLKRRFAHISLAVLFMILPVAAQIDDPIKVDSAVVRLNVGVVDGRGRPIINLGRSDFTLYENGQKQEIVSFETSSAPFSVMLLLDMSGSTKSFRQNITLSASRFLDALGPQDRVAVAEFNNKTKLLNDFTTDRRRAAFSISVANGQGPTEMYQALEFALQKLASETSARKAIVVLSDGVDTKLQNGDRTALTDIPDENISTTLKPGENETLNRILEMADKLGVTIYPLALPTGDPARLADPTPRQVAMYTAARERLQIVADRTGGTLNAIRRLEEMGRLYAEVAADLRTLYTIEYSPSDLARDGKWRSIKVEVNQESLITRTRQGYFAK
ncbi:MAG: VWA domain-containing protein [Acidobacteria bacterium]|nr:VWA domain-containing protein [Acidobacteriota bacterium]